MHVSTTTRRSGENEYNATLLRRSYRQDGKVKKETLANLSHLPPEAIDAIRAVLAGKTVMSVDQAFEIERSLPAGHVTAALTMARRLGLAKLLDRSPCRERDLCVAMIVGRVIGPGSKLGMVRTLGQSTLAQECGVVGADEDDLYAAMDWLVERQDRIEDRLAARHLRDGEMVLYDVSSMLRHCSPQRADSGSLGESAGAATIRQSPESICPRVRLATYSWACDGCFRWCAA